MAENSNNNTNRLSIVGAITIVGTLAVVLGSVLAAIVSPINQQILQLERKHEKLEKELKDFTKEHAVTLSALATIHEKFIEVETQFKGFSQQLGSAHATLSQELHSVQSSLEARAIAGEKRLQEERDVLDKRMQKEMEERERFILIQISHLREIVGIKMERSSTSR